MAKFRPFGLPHRLPPSNDNLSIFTYHGYWPVVVAWSETAQIFQGKTTGEKVPPLEATAPTRQECLDAMFASIVAWSDANRKRRRR